LNENHLTSTDIDLVVSGMNGNAGTDVYYLDVINNLFTKTPVAVFKNLCGEYHTASAFGLWLSANILKRQVVPEVCLFNANKPLKTENILLYNHFAGQQHSLMLVSGI
jgi:3-oxoacyl-[acyl-carrier-protein] synthase II